MGWRAPAALAAIDAAGLSAGQVVLIVGATGGVGAQAVQLAVQAGAEVIATARTGQQRDHVSALGAAQIVDYTEDVAAAVMALHPDGVDVVVHLAGDPLALPPALRAGGRFISTLISSPDRLAAVSVTVVPIYANPTPETLDRLAEYRAQDRTHVVVQRVYGLEQVPAAVADFTGGVLGKLIITVG